MVKHSSGALAALLIALAAASPASADWRTPIRGGAPTLPAHFTPFTNLADTRAGEVRPPAVRSLQGDPVKPEDATDEATPAVWTMPLFDRTLRPEEKTRDLAPSLRELIVRVVGLYDAVVGIDPNDGEAAWRGPIPDGVIAPRLTTASYTEGLGPCETFQPFFSARRTSLNLASSDACLRLRRAASVRLRDLARSSMMSSRGTAPVFAAPLPGARMSSRDFWAAQKRRVQEVEARLRNGWHERDAAFTALDLSR